MDKEKIEKQHKPRVHKILAHSYLVYLISLFFGLLFSAIYPFKIFESSFLLNISSLVLILSTILIFWAQKSSRKFGKNKQSITEKSLWKDRIDTLGIQLLLVYSFLS
ncbi:MAG: hypothetical protein ABH951_00800 [Patescibacteria group bacterium]